MDVSFFFVFAFVFRGVEERELRKKRKVVDDDAKNVI